MNTSSGFTSGSPAPFVSFLMPVYGAEEVLERTLDTITAQDDGTIEIICVDDGSPDRCGQILDDYARTHPCVRPIHEANGGITVARNTAMKAARGTWLCFIDDDDVLASTAVKTFHSVVAKSTTDNSGIAPDVIYFNYEKFTGDMPDQSGNSLGKVETLNPQQIAKLRTDCINRFRSNTPIVSHKTLPTPWAKIYRRAFLNEHNLAFRPEVKHEEDVIFNFEMLSYCQSAVTAQYVSYYYRWQVGSESHRYRPNLPADTLKTLAAYRDIIARRYPNDPRMRELYAYRVLWELLYCVTLGPMHPDNPGTYRERKRQFDALLARPDFAAALRDKRVSTLKFEPKQAVLATLIKYHMFWALNLLRPVVAKAR